MENKKEIFEEIIEEKKYTKFISYDTIKDSLSIRTRRCGDYLVINENGGEKKLKDYFIDRKIPRQKRGQVLLLADGSHVLWVIGDRLSASAKVRADSAQVVKIEFLKEECPAKECPEKEYPEKECPEEDRPEKEYPERDFPFRTR